MAEHVTLVRMVALPRKRNAVIKHMAGWEAQHGPSAPGAMGTLMGGEYDQPDVLWGMIRWDNRRNYQRNADRPEQDAWYQQLRSMLAADPEWHDCSLLGVWDMPSNPPGNTPAGGRSTRAVPASGSAAKAASKAARSPSRTQATSPARTPRSAPASGASTASRPASRPRGSGGTRGGAPRRAPRG